MLNNTIGIVSGGGGKIKRVGHFSSRIAGSQVRAYRKNGHAAARFLQTSAGGIGQLYFEAAGTMRY